MNVSCLSKYSVLIATTHVQTEMLIATWLHLAKPLENTHAIEPEFPSPMQLLIN